jgi:hypothetical protein
MTRGKKNRHRRRCPGFAQRPLPAAAAGEKARGRGRLPEGFKYVNNYCVSIPDQ